MRQSIARCSALLALLTPAVLVAIASGPADASQPDAAPSTPSTPSATTQAQAGAKAKATGQPVPVDSLTTERSQVSANPDGTFTLRSSREAVRALVDGRWRGVDTTLAMDASSKRLRPAVTAVPMSFSNGGDGPLVVMGAAGASEAISWGQPLPAPSVQGSRATFANVLPGVDLVMTAHAEDFSEILVIKNATAAANPALLRLNFPTTVDGLALRPTGDGAAAVDGAGHEVFHATTPFAWDSHQDAAIGATPSVSDPGSGEITMLL